MACRVIIPNKGPNKGKETRSILFDNLQKFFQTVDTLPVIRLIEGEHPTADMIYKRIFEDNFMDTFGDWMTMHSTNLYEVAGIPKEKFEKMYLDENGEPRIDHLHRGGIGELEQYKDDIITIRDKLKADELLERQILWNQKTSDAQTIGEEGALMIVERLERVFGFKAKVINRKDKKWAGKFVADVPIINIAYMRADTAFHEFAHPWVEAIFKDNPALFERLKRELHNTKEGRAILKKVKERYPRLGGNEYYKEAIVTAIGEYAQFHTQGSLSFIYDSL